MSREWIVPFLESMSATGIATDACRAAGITSTTAYNLRRTDPDFAAAWEQALVDSADELEREARRRAVQGVEEPVVYQGQLQPVWARDAQGQPIMESYQARVFKDGAWVNETMQRPVQAIDANGRPVWLTITKKSDALLALMLKGRRKQVFADRTEITGADGGDVKVQDSTARASRVAALFNLAMGRKAGDGLA